MTPAQPPLPTAWNLLFQFCAGNHTSTLMSESLVGLIVTATRQNSGRSLYGFAPLPPPAGGENWPAGTIWASVIVVSFRASFARLSHVAANAGAAIRHMTIHKAHF